MRSSSTTVPINNEIKSKIDSSGRRKSDSSTGLTNDSIEIPIHKSNNSEKVIRFYF